jgi:DASH complex subunit DAM1
LAASTDRRELYIGKAESRYTASILSIGINEIPNETEEDATAAIEALKAAQLAQAEPEPSSAAEKTSYESEAETDTTYGEQTQATTSNASSSAVPPKGILKKKTTSKPKLTNKEKKERGVAIERIVMSLPLEFRGSDPNLRRHIETVIEGFLDREGRGVASELLIDHSSCFKY